MQSNQLLTILFLAVAFYDEVYYAVDSTVRPLLQQDLGLSYAQIGMLLGLPPILNAFLEPLLMLLGDTRWRRFLIIGGGLILAVSAFAVGGTSGFLIVMAAEVIGFPASGAFATLSQATLMDTHHGREPQMMARWTVAGSIASLVTPLLLAGAFLLAFRWRWAYVILGMVGAILSAIIFFHPFPVHTGHERGRRLVWEELQCEAAEMLYGLRQALRNLLLLRWFILLQMAGLVLDFFVGYAALYFTDVAMLTASQTALVMSFLMAAGLLSDLILLPLLERFQGRVILRHSAATTAVLYASFLLAPWAWLKVVLVVLMRFFTMGWYAVMQGEAYAAERGHSGTVKAIGSVFGLLGGMIAWLVGWVAEHFGLQIGLWLLLFGPICILFFVPRPERE